MDGFFLVLGFRSLGRKKHRFFVPMTPPNQAVFLPASIETRSGKGRPKLSPGGTPTAPEPLETESEGPSLEAAPNRQGLWAETIVLFGQIDGPTWNKPNLSTSGAEPIDFCFKELN